MALVEDDSPDASDSDMTSWLILSVVQPVYNGLKFVARLMSYAQEW